MKKIIVSLMVFASLQIVYSQSGWFWQNPLPHGNNHYSVQMLNNLTGYAAGSVGTFMKTENGGINWNIKYYVAGISGSVPYPIYKIYFKNINTGFIITGSTNQSNKILRTVNGGESWDSITNSVYPPLRTIYFVDSIGWCNGSSFGQNNSNVILKTTNNGITWNILNEGLREIYGSFFINEYTGWIVGYHLGSFGTNSRHIYKTTNGGQNFSLLYYENSIQPLTGIYFVNENTGIAAGSNSLKTTDGGYTWNLFNIEMNDVYFINQQIGYAISGNDVKKTTNQGDNWTIIGNYGGNSLSVFDESNIFYAGDYGTVGKSTNGGVNWVSLTGNVSTQILSKVDFVDENTGFIVQLIGNKIFKTNNKGFNWDSLINIPSNRITNLDFINSYTGWIVGINGYISKTTDGGNNWVVQTSNTVGGLGPLYFLNENTGWIISNLDELLITSDGGLNWQKKIINVPLYYTEEAVTMVNELTGFVASSGGILKTSDAGNNWSQYFGWSFYNVCKDNMNNIFAITSSTTEKSTDLGTSWFNVPNPFISGGARCLTMINSHTGFIAGGAGLIFKTIDGGMNWYKQLSNSSDAEIKSICFVDSVHGWAVGERGLIISTSDGGGNFVEVNECENFIPRSYSLHQNYPNPFNPTTKIRFELPALKLRETGIPVRLIVYDLLGREAAALVNEQLKPGTYEVEWDGSNFASGVYFYSLTTNEFTQTKKLILLK